MQCRDRYRQLVGEPGCSLVPATCGVVGRMGVVISRGAEGHGGKVGGIGYFQTQLHAKRAGEALECRKGW